MVIGTCLDEAVVVYKILRKEGHSATAAPDTYFQNPTVNGYGRIRVEANEPTLELRILLGDKTLVGDFFGRAKEGTEQGEYAHVMHEVMEALFLR